MRFEHDGLTLWYGTDDASAPTGDIPSGDNLTITVGVRPIDASNNIEVLYRIGDGPIETLPARWLRNATGAMAQYFQARLPALRPGDRVAYAAVCHCAGRQVPSAEDAKRLDAEFRVTASDGQATAALRRSAIVAPSPELPASGAALTGPTDRLKPLWETRVPNVSTRRRSNTAATSHQSPALAVAQSVTAPVFRLPNPTILELADQARIDLPRAARSALDAAGIRTVEDIRKVTASGELKQLGIADDPAVSALVAHANLGVLGTATQANAALISHGFTSITAIAKTPGPVFIEQTAGDLGGPAAGQIHQRARAQEAILNNIWTHRRVERANGRPVSGGGDAQDPCEQVCRCRDCEAAVSPLAYLSDLIAYVALSGRVSGGGGLSWLDSELHQSFSALPGSCAAVEGQVRQVRIAVEVLRGYLGAQEIAVPEAVEGSYLRNAYIQLLTGLGTSYEALRLARRSDLDSAEAIASTLGIDPVHLPELFFDLSATPLAFTEQTLEQRFGVPATGLVEAGPGDEAADDRPSDLERWRIEHLHAQWRTADHPDDPYAMGRFPVIDPDLIGPDDIRLHTEDGQRALARWRDRRLEVDAELRRLCVMQIQDMIGDVFPGHDLQQFADKLGNGTTAAQAADVIENDLGLTLEGFRHLLALREQERLAPLRPGVEPLTRGERREAGSICLQSKKRRLWYPRWLAEDHHGSEPIKLHPDTFWQSITPPREGHWPPLDVPEDRPLVDPETLELADLPDAPYGVAVRTLWQRRRQWLNDEPTRLRRKHLDLGAEGYVKLLYETFGKDFTDQMTDRLAALSQGLSDDDDAVREARDAIDAHYLTVETLGTLVDVKTRDAAEGAPISEADWQGVYRILARVRALTLFQSRPLGESDDAWKNFEGLWNLEDWQVYKARLPRWRADANARQQWLQSLRSHSRRPIVDPDLLLDNAPGGEGDFTTPLIANEAYVRYQERHDWVEQQALPDRGNDLAWLDARLSERTGLDSAGLELLADEQSQGIEITGRLGQLKLSNAAFSLLLRIRRLLLAGQPVLESEWDDVYGILIQIGKELRFGAWHVQERADGITLSPVFFRLPEPPVLRFPFPEPPPLPQWRATSTERRDWQETLRARSDQQDVVAEAHRTLIRATEEVVLPPLRDALIELTDAQGATLAEKAKWLADRLLIDMQVDGCLLTTRVSQAIETLQGLLWSIRTGQLRDTYPDLALSQPDAFDEEWRWLGSYASWRSAMFVFLYPENVLYPTLRRWESEGFTNLVGELRLGQRLDPPRAERLAKDYATYYRDVTQLDIEASCHAGTRTYWYARSPSGHCYWSRFDNDSDDFDYAQSPWRKIGSLSGEKRTLQILGAVPFGGTDEQPDAILVFAKRKAGTEHELTVARHNLSSETWESNEESEPLALPDDVTAFSAVVTQIRTVQQLPSVVLQDASSGKFYKERFLDDSGSDWEDGEWHQPSHGHLFCGWEGGIVKLWAVVSASRTNSRGWRYYFFEEFAGGDSRLGIGLASQPGLLGCENSWFVDGPNAGRSIWLAAFLWPSQVQPQGDTIFAVAYSANGLSLFEIDTDTGQVTSKSPPHSGQSELWHFWHGALAIDRLPVDSGLPSPIPRRPPQTGVRTQLTLAERRSTYGHWAAEKLFVEYGGALKKFGGRQIAPADQQPLPLRQAVSGIPQQARREYTRSFFDLDQPSRGLNPWLPVPASTFAYTEEYYSLVPSLLALELQRRGYYDEALDWYRTVYDYTEPASSDSGESPRKVWYGLQHEESPDHTTYERAEEWLRSPLYPHPIARTRPNTYTRFTLQSLIRCFLEYGDAEFTRDTSESIPRARTLYETALELLDDEVLHQSLDGCDAKIGEILIAVGRAKRSATGVDLGFNVNDFLEELETLLDPRLEDPRVVGRLSGVFDALQGSFDPNEPRPGPAEIKLLTGLHDAVASLGPEIMTPPQLGSLVGNRDTRMEQAHAALLAQPEIAATLASVGLGVGNDGNIPGGGPGPGPTRPGFPGGEPIPGPIPGIPGGGPISGPIPPGLPGGTLDSPSAVPIDGVFGIDPMLGSGVAASSQAGSGSTDREASAYFSSSLPPGGGGWRPIISVAEIPAPTFCYCIPPNPLLHGLRLHAELNLYKLRTCRNIAGMERTVDPYAAPTDTVSGLPSIGPGGNLLLSGAVTLRPTPYRYPFLVERTRQLVELAQRAETAMLSAIERADDEYYKLLKARQELRLARAGVRLQDLRVREAESGVTLAELQRDRVDIQITQLNALLDQNISVLESIAIGLMFTSMGLLYTAAGLYTAAAKFGDLQAEGQAVSATSQALSQTASIISTYAAYERRKKDWQNQLELVEQDKLVANQQIQLAEDRVRVVEQERRIAEISADQAEVTVEYLSDKFNNAQLYQWMSGVLEGVYSFFLQQATAVAKLAEAQLAFERQEVPPQYIQDDYWDTPSDFGFASRPAEGNPPDRRGLTGSARLLQDLYQLDQFAFDTDQRKLQLTKTISLARLFPVEFQRFRETGILKFRTQMELFDRDFPGHYLRLIKRVRVSVIALIPPSNGIRATLTTSGTSRVVIGGYGFQTVVRNYGPQSVALSAPQNTSGLFELQQQPDKLLPFEGLGVDTDWELRMPRASNPFDYSTIADVLLTFDYTALDSFDYRQAVIQTLGDSVGADRAFSFRHQFPDQWYDLHNPDQTATPMTVRFETRREDFPPNLERLRIAHIALYFARRGDTAFEIGPVDLRFTENAAQGAIGGAATSVDGIISTRRGNGGAWLGFGGKDPSGTWTLALPNTAEVRNRFASEQIEDILFVVTFSGDTPTWPL